MKDRLNKLARFARRLHDDEQGAEMVEKLLIIGAVVLPILGLLILFRNNISEWVTDSWSTVRTDSDSGMPDSSSMP